MPIDIEKLAELAHFKVYAVEAASNEPEVDPDEADEIEPWQTQASGGVAARTYVLQVTARYAKINGEPVQSRNYTAADLDVNEHGDVEIESERYYQLPEFELMARGAVLTLADTIEKQQKALALVMA